MLQDEKMSQLSGNNDSMDSSSESASDNLLVVSSEKFNFPSEEYLIRLNEFFNKVQNEIDNAGVSQNVGTLQDYQVIPSEDSTTVMIQAPFVNNELVGPLVHITEDFSNNDFESSFHSRIFFKIFSSIKTLSTSSKPIH